MICKITPYKNVYLTDDKTFILRLINTGWDMDVYITHQPDIIWLRDNSDSKIIPLSLYYLLQFKVLKGEENLFKRHRGEINTILKDAFRQLLSDIP